MTPIVLPLVAAISPAAAMADEQPSTIVVTAERRKNDDGPATKASVNADDIAVHTNAFSAEDALKYVPSLVIRKRHIGDQQSPIATRTSGLGSSARSLIFADGVPLSALIANNNTAGSPRWAMVSPDEIARIDVLYGPYSAEYAGNSIGTVINITTRTPEKLEGTLGVSTNVQQFDLYGTHEALPSWQFTGSIGDRVGKLALLASVTRTLANSQPVALVTAAALPAGTSGGFDDRNRTGAPIKVLGAGGKEHHVQDAAKVKAVLDLGSNTAVSYVLGLWRDDTAAGIQTYLTGASGPAYTAAFTSGLYAREAEHWSHSLSVRHSGPVWDWSVIGTLYRYARDIQRSPTVAPPTALTGGAGQSVRQDGTGWMSLDARGERTIGSANRASFGSHFDQYRLENDRYALSDWLGGFEQSLNQASRGRTRTFAIWAQDVWTPTPRLSITAGARYEWWRAFDGINFSTSPALNLSQPELESRGISPKLSLRWQATPAWSVRTSFGQAYRFPTVGELYQAITTGVTLSVPNPNLRPERARSAELALVRDGASGSLRLSLFSEDVRDALISQSAPLVAGSSALFNFVQNVDRTRARGAEVAVEQRNIVPNVDFDASLTYADAITADDKAFPAAVGKRLPSVPRWKGAAVLTWHPDPTIAVTGAFRFASRNYAALDNSDVVGNTWQGFYRYAVFDLRAVFRPTDRFEFAVGVDNLNNDRYFLFHSFPQRSFTVSAKRRF